MRKTKNAVRNTDIALLCTVLLTAFERLTLLLALLARIEVKIIARPARPNNNPPRPAIVGSFKYITVRKQFLLCHTHALLSETQYELFF